MPGFAKSSLPGEAGKISWQIKPSVNLTGSVLTPAKHQLLLAIKGHPDPAGPTIGDVADYLVLRHHSAVGLIDRAVEDGLVMRNRDRRRGVVRVTLTRAGNDKLDALAEAHIEEIAHLAPTMRTLWEALEHADGDDPHPAARRAR